jgi:hypothetical protein
MTEAEWLACEDPQWMAPFLQAQVSERKLRLIACACCRIVWHLLHKRSRLAIKFLEGFVDGTVTQNEWQRLYNSLHQYSYSPVIPKGIPAGPGFTAAQAVFRAAEVELRMDWCLEYVVGAQLSFDQEQQPALLRRPIIGLIREVVGNPFRMVALNQAWRTTTAVEIARAIHDDQDFTAMPVLADALQEADCEVPAILDHCRQPGEHVRGCWVVDLVLGKE